MLRGRKALAFSRIRNVAAIQLWHLVNQSAMTRVLDHPSEASRLISQRRSQTFSDLVPFAYPQQPRKNFVLKMRNRFVFLDSAEIQWIGSKAGVISVHRRSNYLRTRETMDAVEKHLSLPLIRINRSAIVNLDFITEMRIRSNGTCSIFMEDRTELLMSRSYRKRLQWLFGDIL